MIKPRGRVIEPKIRMKFQCRGRELKKVVRNQLKIWVMLPIRMQDTFPKLKKLTLKEFAL